MAQLRSFLAAMLGCLLAPALGAAVSVDVGATDWERALHAADAALELAPITITTARAKLSEGGTNDFYSNADYFWPDPTKPDGLPYINHDGQSNPGNFNEHRARLRKLTDAVAALGAAYKLTGEPRYAAKAAELLKVFFLDPRTRMNPNLQYSQAVPGRSPGRSYGIIDGLHLIETPRAIEAMEDSPAFPRETLRGMKEWFGALAHWMETSANGRQEAAAKNNHAVAYWLQVAVFSRFAGDEPELEQCRKEFKEVFVGEQMAADGSFPRELTRTKPYGYSIFQLDNMATLCQVLSRPDDNLWNFQLPDGRGMRRAMEFLYPYLADKSKWPHAPDVQAWAGWPAREPSLLFAGLAYDRPEYLALWKRLPADPTDEEVRRNIAITQPALWVANEGPEILTPPDPETPRINGPSVFGVRPGSPFLYRIPATGKRPMEFAVDDLPHGLKVDAATGEITGRLAQAGECQVTLRAKNELGAGEKTFRIVVGDEISLTPAMGWNSWNCWGSRVTAEKVLQSARGMAASGLVNHGWTFINIDDAWQGKRGGPFNAIQGNTNFPDMAGLCTDIHALGLKAGIYSTPWTTSYAGHIGGSAESPDGEWSRPTVSKKGIINKKVLPWAIGRYSFATNDARQWAAWGIDYLKYDWNPNELPETREMFGALRGCGRDVVFSLSNATPFSNAPALSQYANSWRTTGDIRDNWASMSAKGFGEGKWAKLARPGHWNDPDMLVVGDVGWGHPHPTHLTPDEQYTHISLWCLLSAPLLLGCDLQHLDDFTRGLLSNDEVLALDQDALGRQATCMATNGSIRLYAKPLANGSTAVGIFNVGNDTASGTIPWPALGLTGARTVRDLWREKDLGEFSGKFEADVRPHGVLLVRLDERK